MRNKRLINRIAGVGILACLALTLVTGAGQGMIPASAAKLGASTAPAAQREQVLVVQVYFRSNAERDSLANELGAEEVATTQGFLTVIVSRDRYNELLARGLRVEIDQEQTKQANDPHIFDTFYGGYKTVEEIYTYLDQRVSAYPNLVEKVDIGDSWCKSHPGQCTQPEANNGYDLWAMHITNRNIAGPKPVFWYEAGIHAREIATPEVAMRFINWLLDGYGVNADATWLVDYHDIWVMPTFNPDGHHIVEAGGGGSSPYWQRKNANKTNGCTTWPPTSGTQFGTDNNRNFPFLWGCCNGSSGAPCDQTYRGASAGSDDETIAVTNKIRTLIPDQRGPNNTDPAPITATGVYQDMHTNASLDLYPWGWTGTASGNGPDLQNIGRHMSAVNAGGNGYQACQPPNCLYAVDGDAVDWGYGELGAASFTTELGGSSFFPPYTQIDSMWNQNSGMLIYLSKIARTPYLTTRGPDMNTVATNPITVTQGIPSHLTGTANHNWTGNGYVQNIAAAEYYVDTPPWAGGTGIAMNGNFNSSTVAVDADINTSSLSPGRHIIFVRGRGVNDYAGFQSWGYVSAAFLDVLPPAGTPTNTPTPCLSCTNTPTVTNTPTNTNTPVPPTSTRTSTPVPPTATDTNTPPPGSTDTPIPTPCTISFTDVFPTDYFYAAVTYLYCHGAISGYGDNTFRPSALTTRGQLTKIVVLANGFLTYTPPSPTFQDVPETHTFYQYIETAYHFGLISGYSCGSNCLEFRAEANVTRAQLCKIVVNAAGWSLLYPTTPTFTDVGRFDTFYTFIETAYAHNIISGYSCGTGCLEFRPSANATRGQISKIVYNEITVP